VPHKPLLLLWLFGQFAATGSSVATYWQAEDPVSQLINDFGPPVASSAATRQRAAMPFVHLERELWDLRDAAGRQIAPDAPERRGWLLEQRAVGRLHAAVEQFLADPGTLATAVRLLLDTRQAGGRCARRPAASDTATAAAGGRRHVHLLAPPASLQRRHSALKCS
jgi:putative restriction endonuclease